VPTSTSYIGRMATIMTIGEQRRAGEAARKVGGYSELIRLETERRKAKGQGHVVRDTTSGRYSFSPTKTPKK
jgi:hypothetical protein